MVGPLTASAVTLPPAAGDHEVATAVIASSAARSNRLAPPSVRNAPPAYNVGPPTDSDRTAAPGTAPASHVATLPVAASNAASAFRACPAMLLNRPPT